MFFNMNNHNSNMKLILKLFNLYYLQQKLFIMSLCMGKEYCCGHVSRCVDICIIILFCYMPGMCILLPYIYTIPAIFDCLSVAGSVCYT